MSISLRDAQHLSWKAFRKLGDMPRLQQHRERTPFEIVTTLLEEADEVSSTVRGLEGLGPSGKPNTKDTLATNLSDLLFMVFILAEHYGIELEESFMQAVDDRFMSML